MSLDVEQAREQVRAALRAWRDLNDKRDSWIYRGRVLGMPVKELAEITGLHPGYVGQVARGRKEQH